MQAVVIDLISETIGAGINVLHGKLYDILSHYGLRDLFHLCVSLIVFFLLMSNRITRWMCIYFVTQAICDLLKDKMAN